MSAGRVLERIVATTDVHSDFDRAHPMLAELHAARERALVVDCGDFFEGSGYYRLGDGRIERQALELLYDIIAPGNHGWRHYFEPDLRALTVSANAVDAGTGEPLFRPVQIIRIDGRMVGLTGVLGEQAFSAIPRTERIGHTVVPPDLALHELRRRYRNMVDDWIVLSHSGFDHDLALAAACPFISVIFSGHCHSEQYGPVRVRNTLVIKGHELGAGYAEAVPAGRHWNAQARGFAEGMPVLDPVARLYQQIDVLRDRLTRPLGPLAAPFRDTLADRREILTLTARQLHARLKAEVVLNDTCLRPVHLGSVLYQGDLLAIEPFANQLVRTTLPSHCDLDVLAAQAGPLVVVRGPSSEGPRHAVTTQYLADTYLGGRWKGQKLPLAHAVQAVLTGQTGDTP
ncbi:metallophosphoesterase [Nonomuraea sp. B19D2]|uniref:metallophosphoesterase n=1 Tax=Nonomuraea sp. B19D2 TaxID=3159561 RepID=UPI0032DB9910